MAIQTEILPTTFVEHLHISLFVVSFAFAYIITYSAIEADSPSLVIILAIAGGEASGVDRKELEDLLTDDILVKPRLKDLLRDNMAILVDGRYRITPKGRRMANIFEILSRVLGTEKGG